MSRCRFVVLLCLLPALVGCRIPALAPAASEPGRLIVREQLVIDTDFALPAEHRLLDELAALRTRIHQDLALPASERPIHVRVFATEPAYRAYMQRNYPAVAGRRAFFVRSDTELAVYAWWGDHIAEDLRHEVTHGYLHSTLPSLPLWLDEGLAEYYETPASFRGRHNGHIRLLLAELRDGRWHPNLDRLQHLDALEEMQHLEYAESWLWTHFLLQTTESRQALLKTYLQDQILGKQADQTPLPERLAGSESGDLGAQLVAHLLLLGKE